MRTTGIETSALGNHRWRLELSPEFDVAAPTRLSRTWNSCCGMDGLGYAD